VYVYIKEYNDVLLTTYLADMTKGIQRTNQVLLCPQFSVVILEWFADLFISFDDGLAGRSLQLPSTEFGRRRTRWWWHEV
jgi:hypothetical protein